MRSAALPGPSHSSSSQVPGTSSQRPSGRARRRPPSSRCQHRSSAADPSAPVRERALSPHSSAHALPMRPRPRASSLPSPWTRASRPRFRAPPSSPRPSACLRNRPQSPSRPRCRTGRTGSSSGDARCANANGTCRCPRRPTSPRARSQTSLLRSPFRPSSASPSQSQRLQSGGIGRDRLLLRLRFALLRLRSRISAALAVATVVVVR